MVKSHNEYIKLAESAARGAGAVLLEAYADDPGVVSEAGKDIKTEADTAAERSILEALRATGLAILSEECGMVQESGVDESPSTTHTRASTVDPRKPLTGLTWIIDPLDGTFNFTRGFPMCCVSIALWDGMTPIGGVIYDFVGDRLYSGVVGDGAYGNGEPIRVSSIAEPSRAALATGFPSSRDYGEAALAESIRAVQRFKKIRMLGSAACSLAHVAAGHLDAYFEEDIWLWDVAAGLALVKAAGGDFSISEVKDSWQLDVFASNGRLPDLRQ